MLSSIKKFGLCLLVPTIVVALANALIHGYFSPFYDVITDVLGKAFLKLGLLVEDALVYCWWHIIPERVSYLAAISVCVWVLLAARCAYPNMASMNGKKWLVNTSLMACIVLWFVAMKYSSTVHGGLTALVVFGGLCLMGAVIENLYFGFRGTGERSGKHDKRRVERGEFVWRGDGWVLKKQTRRLD